jgi:hypothetical protein
LWKDWYNKLWEGNTGEMISSRGLMYLWLFHIAVPISTIIKAGPSEASQRIMDLCYFYVIAFQSFYVQGRGESPTVWSQPKSNEEGDQMGKNGDRPEEICA